MAPLPIALLGLTGLVEYRIKEACSKALAHWETQRKTEAYIELGSSVHGSASPYFPVRTPRPL